MASISFALILLLSFSVSTLASPPAESQSNSLQSACAKTPEPKLCVDNLSRFSKSKTADIHELTVLSVSAATHYASDTSKLLKINMDKLKDKSPVEVEECLVNCSGGMSDAVSVLLALSDAVKAKKMSDINAFVSQIYADTAACKNSCKGDDFLQKFVVKMTDKMEKLGQITVALAELDQKQ